MSIVSSPLSVARADEKQEMHDLTVLYKKLVTAKASQDETLAAYDEFVQAHPGLAPGVAVIVETRRAEILSKTEPDAALAVLDKALAHYSQPGSKAGDGSIVRLVRFKSAILVSQKKWPEVEALAKDNWTRTLSAGQNAGTNTPTESILVIRNYNQALWSQQKEAQIAPLLMEAFGEIPALLDGQGQVRDGSLYNELVLRLVADGRKEEALGWAKLQYMMCSFDKDSLDRSSKLLSRVWAAQDDFAAAAAFAASQSDAAAPNPLATVKLPALSSAALEVATKAVSGPQRKENVADAMHRLITLDLARGNYGAAMQKARTLLQERLDSPEGAQEVARVFKAADLNLVGANAFLAFLKGEGANPFPAFTAKYGDGITAPANGE